MRRSANRTVDGKGRFVLVVEVTTDDHVGLADAVLELDLDRGPALWRVALDEAADLLAAIDDLGTQTQEGPSSTHAEAEVHSQRDRREDRAARSAAHALSATHLLPLPFGPMTKLLRA